MVATVMVALPMAWIGVRVGGSQQAGPPGSGFGLTVSAIYACVFSSPLTDFCFPAVEC